MPDPLTEEEFLTAEAAHAAAVAAANARFVEWLAGQTDTFKALANELFAMQDERKMAHGLTARIFRDDAGKIVYEVSCRNGVHQSHDSHEAALESMVDSFRIRIEHLESTHERMRAFCLGGDIKMARRACLEMAAKVREANPGIKGDELDALVEAELSKREGERAKQIADAKNPPKREP